MSRAKCSQVGVFFDPDRKCGAWASHEVGGKPYCRHHPSSLHRKPEGLTLLEEAVWDALKNSRCPREHRYQGPNAGLPCRWCRAAHAITLILIKVEAGLVKPLEVIAQFERQLGWTMADPVASGSRERIDKGCDICGRRPGEPRKCYRCDPC